eukprot:6212244-Pleurochrysis_carterae.AAC.7
MVQRSPTLVVSTDSVLRFGLGPLYSEDGIPHEFADYIATTLPYGVVERRWREMAAQMRENDADLHERLRKVADPTIMLTTHVTATFAAFVLIIDRKNSSAICLASRTDKASRCCLVTSCGTSSLSCRARNDAILRLKPA